MNNLTMDEMRYVQDELRLKGKKTSISYILLIFLGPIGLHLAYLEKTKLAITRALLTASTVAILFPIRSAVLTSEINGITMELQQYSSALFVLSVVLALTTIFWQLYDLFALPSMVTKVNSKIESKAGQNAILSRNLENLLIENEVADRMIERVSDKITSEVDSKVEEIRNSVLSIHEEVKDKNDETLSIQKDIKAENEKILLIQKGVKAENEKALLIQKGAEIENEKAVLMLNTLKGNQSEINELKKEIVKNVLEELNEKLPVEEDISVKDAEEINETDPKYAEDEFQVIEKHNLTPEAEESDEVDLKDEDREPEDHKDHPQDNLGIEQTEDVKNNSIKEVKEESPDKVDDEKVNSEGIPVNDKDGYLTVSEARKKGKGYSHVSGFIVGTMSPNENGVITENFDNDLNILIAEDKDERNRNKMIAVQLSKNSKLKNKAGLQKNPDNLGKQVIVKGNIERYFKGLGLKKVNSISFQSED